MKALQRPGRMATVAGAVATISATSLIAIVVGTASAAAPAPAPAAQPARCVDNVNVREQPRVDSRAVALCKAGTTVEAGEISNGFVKLNDLGGWAAQEFISVNGAKPVKPGSGTSPSQSGTTDPNAAPDGTQTGPRSRSQTNGQDDKPKPDSTAPKPQAPPKAPGPLGGIVP